MDLNLDEAQDKAMKLLQECESVTIDQKLVNETKICEVISMLGASCKIKKFNDGNNLPYKDENFSDCSSKSNYFHLIQIVLSKTYQILESNSRSDEVENMVVDLFFLCAQYYNPESYWSNQENSAYALNIIDFLRKLCNCNSFNELIYGQPSSTYQRDCDIKVFPKGIFTLISIKCSKDFNSNSWKCFPFYIDLYSFMLKNVLKEEEIYDAMPFFLPGALFFLDDWEMQHKLLGLKSLNIIIDKHNPSDICLFGRAEVIYDAIKKKMYTKEEELLKMVYPPLIKVSYILENNPKNFNSSKRSYFDEVMDHLIREMMFEQKLISRSIYITSLQEIVIAMEIHNLRWINDILECCSSYLETYESPQAQDRICALKILQTLIKECWPRIPSHFYKVIKMVCKLLFTISKKDSDLEEQAKIRLEEESKLILILLNEIDPSAVKAICFPTQNIVTNSSQLNSVKSFLSNFYSNSNNLT